MMVEQNAWIDRNCGVKVKVPRYMKEIIEEISHIARTNQEINQSSGVSARMSICNYETLISNAERRAIKMNENGTVPRISDLRHVFASSRGKVELDSTLDDEQEDEILRKIIREAVKKIFDQYFKIDVYQEEIKLLKELEKARQQERNYTKKIIELQKERREKIEQFKKDIMQIRANLDRIEAEVKLE